MVAGRPDRRPHPAAPDGGCRHVDRHLAPVAHKVGIVQTETLCQEALDRFDPHEAEARRLAAAEARHVDVPTRDAGRTGTVEVTASVDTADALDLETAVAQAAAELESRRIHRVTGRAPVDGTRGDRPPLPRRRPQHRPPDRPVGQAPPGRRSTCTSGTRTPAAATPPAPRSRWSRCKRLVHQPRHPGDHPPDPRPQRPHPGRRLRGPRPTRRPGHRTRRHLHPPLVHPTRPGLRQGPLPALRPRRHHLIRQHRATVPNDIIGPRPTTAGPIGSSDPAPTCGARPTATGTTATAPAPPTSDGSPRLLDRLDAVLRADPVCPRDHLLHARHSRQLARRDEDARLHDRQGLVARNPYGDDGHAVQQRSRRRRRRPDR